MSNRHSFFSNRLAAVALTHQFLDDARRDVIRYSAGWTTVPVPAGEPYRLLTTTVMDNVSQLDHDSAGGTIDFRFTSQGEADEYVSVHAAIDPAVPYEIYLNDILVATRGGIISSAVTYFSATGGNFYTGLQDNESYFASPWFKVQPIAGINHLKIIKLPLPNGTQSPGFYFDGFGMNLRGGPVPLPLLTHELDDQDVFFTYDGIWNHEQNNTAWPGGLLGNTLTYNTIIHPGDPVTQVTTDVLSFAGTPQEGFLFRGAAEDDGPLQLYLQALDAADSSWQFYASVATAANVYRYVPGNAIAPGNSGSSFYENGVTQSYYRHLNTPMTGIMGLPAGRYRLRLVKPANVADGAGYVGNRATYLDSASYYTRID